MKKETLKLTFYIVITLFSTALVAEPPEPCSIDCAPYKSAPDPCAKCTQIWPTCGPDWIITPNAGPCVANGFDAHVSTSFIYWTAREDHLSFAYLEPVQTTSSGITVTSKSLVEHPNWNFRPGFKIAVGYLYDHDGWDILAEYTWLRVRSTQNSLSLVDSNTSQIKEIWTSSIYTESSTKVSALWQLDFNVIDVELGRNFFISRYLKLRPHFGFKGTWQNQHFEVEAFGITNNTASIAIDKHQLDYWGIGIRTGLDTAWHFNRCFSLYGEFTASLLWESFKAEEKNDIVPIEVGAAEPLTALYVGNDIRLIKPVLELTLGLRWETWFCCDHYHFSIEAGWEEQWWCDQNQLFNADQETRQGDLFLHGLTLKTRIDF